MKVTRRQIRKIIKEHQANQQAQELLNEGFFDWLKKLGEAMIDAYKKQEAVTGEFKKGLDSQISKIAGKDEKLKGVLGKHSEDLVGKYLSKAQNSRKELLKNIMADAEKIEGIDKTDRQKLALSTLSYLWSAASTP